MIENLSLIDLPTLSTFMVAAVILNLTPGADVMFVLASGLSGGVRNALAASFGITTGSVIHILMATIGLAAILQTYPLVFLAIKYCGVAYLLYLAIITWRSAPVETLKLGNTPARQAYFRGMITNLLNPKVALFILAFLPQFTDPSTGPVWKQMLLLGALFTTSGLIITCAYGVFSGLVARQIRSASRIFNKISSLVYGGLAARLAME